MFARSLQCSDVYAKFGKEPLTYGELEKFAGLLDTRVTKKVTKSKTSRIFTHAPLPIGEKEYRYTIRLDEPLSLTNPKLTLFLLAKELGHRVLHGGRLIEYLTKRIKGDKEEKLLTEEEPKKRMKNLYKLMDIEATYFALCCFLPGNLLDEYNEFQNLEGKSLETKMHEYLNQLKEPVELYSDKLNADELIELRWRGHFIFKTLLCLDTL